MTPPRRQKSYFTQNPGDPAAVVVRVQQRIHFSERLTALCAFVVRRGFYPLPRALERGRRSRVRGRIRRRRCRSFLIRRTCNESHPREACEQPKQEPIGFHRREGAR